MSRVTLVCGPPASGKSTWVRARMVRGDMVVDFDAIFAALSGLPVHDKPDRLIPYAIAARDAVLSKVEIGTHQGRTYVIATMPRASDREALAQRLGASVVVLETHPRECATRLHKAMRPARGVYDVIHRWWDEYEPRAGEIVVATGSSW